VEGRCSLTILLLERYRTLVQLLRQSMQAPSTPSVRGACSGPAASHAQSPGPARRAVRRVVPDAGLQPEGHPGLLVALAGRARRGGKLLAGGVRGRVHGAPAPSQPLGLPRRVQIMLLADAVSLTKNFIIPCTNADVLVQSSHGSDFVKCQEGGSYALPMP